MYPPEISALLLRALSLRAQRLLELTAGEAWVQDPEGIHLARVASRRVRAVVHLLAPEAHSRCRRYARQLRRFTKALGDTRETDVHLALLAALASSSQDPVHRAAIEHIHEAVLCQGQELRHHMRRKLRKVSLSALAELKPHSTPPPPLPDLQIQNLAHGLGPQLTRALALQPAPAPTMELSSLHAFRIQLKKLRYSLELFEEACPALTLPLQDLHSLQTALGDHHDLATLQSLLQAHHAHLTSGGWQILASATAAVIAQIGAQSQAQLAIIQGLLQVRPSPLDRIQQLLNSPTQPGASA